MTFHSPGELVGHPSRATVRIPRGWRSFSREKRNFCQRRDDDWATRRSHLEAARSRSALANTRDRHDIRARQSRVVSRIVRSRLTSPRVSSRPSVPPPPDPYSTYRRVPSDTPPRRRRGTWQVSSGEVARFFHGPGKALNFGLAPHSPRVSGTKFILPTSCQPANEREILFNVSVERRRERRRGETWEEAIANESFRRKADKARAASWNILTYIMMKLERGGSYIVR